MMSTYADQLAMFLVEKKGGMAVLLAVDIEKGTLHRDFEDKVHVSRATIADRLKEAKELNLVETTLLPDDHGNAKRHQLTELGLYIRAALESVQLNEVYQEFLRINREMDDKLNEITNWVEEVEGFQTENEVSPYISNELFKETEALPGDFDPLEIVQISTSSEEE